MTVWSGEEKTNSGEEPDRDLPTLYNSYVTAGYWQTTKGMDYKKQPGS